MVSEAQGRPTFTAAEAEVMRMLQFGGADVGRRTEKFIKRPAMGGEPFEIRMVESKVTKRLVRAGWVRIDLGGVAHLTEKAEAAMGEASS